MSTGCSVCDFELATFTRISQVWHNVATNLWESAGGYRCIDPTEIYYLVLGKLDMEDNAGVDALERIAATHGVVFEDMRTPVTFTMEDF